MIKYVSTWFLLLLVSGCAFLLPTRSITRRNSGVPSKYLRGTFHVHSIFSNDSRAQLSRIVEFSEDFALDFVIITDHNTLVGQETYRTMERTQSPMLIFGDEISTDDGHLIALGIKEGPPPGMSSQMLIDWIHENGGYAVVAHPFSKKRPWTNWQLRGIDGMEIYNFGHTLYETNKLKLLGTGLFFLPTSFLNVSRKLSADTFKFWDELQGNDPVVGLAATDAHLKLLDLPPMRGVFRQALRSVTLYVPSDRFNEHAVLRNLMSGNSFMVFESLGIAPNFSFSAKTSVKTYQSGETITTKLPLTFFVEAPGAYEIRLLRDGTIVEKTRDEILTSPVIRPGAYRVEVYRRTKPWILTNPIYVNQVGNSS